MFPQLIGPGGPELHPGKMGHMGQHAERHIAKKYFDSIQNSFKLPAPGNYLYFPAVSGLPDTFRGSFGYAAVFHDKRYESLKLFHI
jgi:hypothetical protein